MIKAYLSMWKNCFNFVGKTSVKDFWLAYIMNTIVMYIVLVPCVLITVFPLVAIGISAPVGVLLVSVVYILIFHIPIIPMYIRRLRDTGISFGICLIFTVALPVLGSMILACLKYNTKAETRREKLQRILRPYIEEGSIKEVANFDTACICMLYDKVYIWFIYTDLLKNSDQIAFYTKTSKVILTKENVEQFKNASEEEIAKHYTNNEIHNLKKILIKQGERMRRVKACLKIGLSSFVLTIGAGVYGAMLFCILSAVLGMSIEAVEGVMLIYMSLVLLFGGMVFAITGGYAKIVNGNEVSKLYGPRVDDGEIIIIQLQTDKV